LAALIGSLACLIVITSIEEAPTMKMVVSYIEETTMCLLFAMMIIVDCVAATGALHVMAVSNQREQNVQLDRLSALCFPSRATCLFGL